ncbi:DUF3597 domain-containing protein [Aureimonas fodinaquatilis]|uniref:DUF3597 domain-containing protein n=1 Tax=Aureimonas fodinaquatilis TaxID=2565783 RepID=A0A5B0DR20_9HYPH|nr:DUF3597 domain-containing protein [Aureimonas fodinaquatilis]KAA0968432.1 DUF3597 domain-containing protein [Aureimonas fodinaquatilis]
MGIFDRIKNAIFGEAQAAPAESAETAAPVEHTTSAPAASAAPAGLSPASSASVAPDAMAATPAAVDVSAIMDQAVAKSGQKLDWRHSIVDLMKALGLDSSLTARKELASEFNYTGDMSDSATMNIWLHKVLLKKLAENGGTVPAELLD